MKILTEKEYIMTTKGAVVLGCGFLVYKTMANLIEKYHDINISLQDSNGSKLEINATNLNKLK